MNVFFFYFNKMYDFSGHGIANKFQPFSRSQEYCRYMVRQVYVGVAAMSAIRNGMKKTMPLNSILAQCRSFVQFMFPESLVGA